MLIDVRFDMLSSEYYLINVICCTYNMHVFMCKILLVDNQHVRYNQSQL